MKNLRRVIWSKGMFLTPQHFQAQDSFYADNLQFRFTESLYCNWGVSELVVDGAAITNGQFTITRARGILPDGLVFAIPDVDAAPPGRQFRDSITGQDSLDVYLSIPEARPSGKNITHLPAASTEPATVVDTRYIAEKNAVIDENLGKEEKPVQLGRKNFRLLFVGEEVLDGCSTLRIARIVRDENGKFILDPEFIAPCLDISSSAYLTSILKRQAELLKNKSTTLGGGRRKGQGLADVGTGDIQKFWLLHTVNSYRPELQHISKTRHGHPEPLFVTMLRLAGALSTFALDTPIPELPDYDHDNLGPCFTTLDSQIRTLLETVIPSNCISIPLRLSADKSVWTGTVPKDQYFRDSQFFLAIAARLPVEELINRVHQLVKVATTGEIEHLIRWALPGVSLRHAPTPPPACPFRLDNQYFALSQNDPLWDGIVKSRNISLFVPGDIPDPKMELLVVLK